MPRAGLVGLSAALLLGVSAAVAQDSAPQEMTLDELEAYIAEQKAALESVIANKEKTEREVENVQQALEQITARESEFVAEIEALCDEREELEPGTREGCLTAASE